MRERTFLWWERLWKMRRELAGRREENGVETGLLDAREARGCQGLGGEMVTGDGVGVDVGVDEFFLREKARAREKRPQKSPR